LEEILSNAVLANDETILKTIVSHFLNFGARAESDARWLCNILPADLLGFLRAEVSKAIGDKAGDPVKARKIFLSMGKTAKTIFGPEYPSTKRAFDNEARAVVRQT